MKRTSKILTAACAVVALSASLAFAADTTAKTTASAAPVSCPGAASGQMGPGMMGASAMGTGMMGSGQMGAMMNGAHMMSADQMGRGMAAGAVHMRGTGSGASGSSL